jgi:formylglycine-generating enzyme required for sulfatase activity
MKFVRIEPGEFLMGTTKDQVDQVMHQFPSSKQEWFNREQPQHLVKITRPFFLGIHEVTVGEFRRFVEATAYQTEAEKDGKGSYVWDEAKKAWVLDSSKNWRNPGFAQTGDHPVVCVSHDDALAFCQWLSVIELRTYRLPTEAEWEYACRAGTTTLYPNGDDPERLVSIANVADATLKKKFTTYTCINGNDGYAFTASVGSFAPNPWGLYDMIGNVSEWCADWYGEEYYASSPPTNPRGASEASRRVLRGGSCYYVPWFCRPAFRSRFLPVNRRNDLGFRVVLVQE